MNKQLIIAEALICCALSRLERATIDEQDQQTVQKINGALLELANGHSILERIIDPLPLFDDDDFETVDDLPFTPSLDGLEHGEIPG